MAITTENSTRRYYETHASEYFRGTCNVDLSSLWNKLGKRLKLGALILDLGCGSGRDLLHFSQRGFR
jgi:SAM-dependent methyltransferase